MAQSAEKGKILYGVLLAPYFLFYNLLTISKFLFYDIILYTNEKTFLDGTTVDGKDYFMFAFNIISEKTKRVNTY